MRNFEGIIFYEHEYIRKFLNLHVCTFKGSSANWSLTCSNILKQIIYSVIQFSGHFRLPMEPAHLDIRLNESRLVIDRTPREVQFFVKFYYPKISEKNSKIQFQFSCWAKIKLIFKYIFFKDLSKTLNNFKLGSLLATPFRWLLLEESINRCKNV